jgi:hypothetical protein
VRFRVVARRRAREAEAVFIAEARDGCKGHKRDIGARPAHTALSGTVEVSLMKVSPHCRVVGARILSSRATREVFASVDEAGARQPLK